MRTFFLWLTGILASAIVGSLVGGQLSTGYSNDGAFLGMIAGPLIFTCARLWLAPKI